ncbi:hypothetical protein [Corynebacterium sp. HS2168-gen11]|uniref:hypothetical protein n=1 Tax=Corynebacterium sp. HS2168-gen11 TaxID=2974027 RepID=UPI00216B6326|nr:hypothetical protein [Corynebacterium sp. HS2168-gen11]MCS4535294.1 hypothetical protein [Corynebacterium sp. HS2168-gen11]
MSISREFDEYIDQHGGQVHAEVIPESECEVFLSDGGFASCVLARNTREDDIAFWESFHS